MDLHGRKALWKNAKYLPRFIILDEIHIYEGQAGSHVSNLARRLRVYLKNIKDRNGNVISAVPGVRGTTNNSRCLTEPAKRAALATKFNKDDKAPSKQIGKIVYSFSLSN